MVRVCSIMVTALLSQICTIQKQVIGSNDAAGRPTYTLTTVHANVKCRHDPLRFRSRERTEPGANQAIMQEMIFTEYFTDVTSDMKILLGTQTYEIISISPIRNNVQGNHLEIEVIHSENA